MMAPPRQERMVRYIVHIAGRQLIIPFDSWRPVADLVAEIESRAHRQFAMVMMHQRILALHSRTPKGQKLKNKHLLHATLNEGEAIFVALSGTGDGPPPPPGTAQAGPSMPEPGAVASGPSAGGPKVATSSGRPLSARACRPSSMGKRPASAQEREGISHPSDRPEASPITIQDLMEEAPDARSEARPAWAAAEVPGGGDEGAVGDRPSRDPGHGLSIMLSGQLRAPGGTPRGGSDTMDGAMTPLSARSDRRALRLSGSSDRHAVDPSEAHEALVRKREEEEAEVQYARRAALRRFPSDANFDNYLPKRGQAGVGSKAGFVRRLSRREKFMNRLLLEANASSGPIGVVPHAPPAPPAWKERVLDRAKVTALAPGRQPPKLYRSLPVDELQAKLRRPASAGSLRESASQPQLGGFGKRPSRAGGRCVADEDLPEQPRQLSASASVARITSSRYVLEGVHELEFAVSGPVSGPPTALCARRARPAGSATQGRGGALGGPGSRSGALATPQGGQGGLAPRTPGTASTGFLFPARSASAGRVRARSPAAHERLEAERRLFFYTDGVAKEELDAYYLREKEDRLREQIAEREAIEQAPVDARFAHIDDGGEQRLFAAAHSMKDRLVNRLGLAERRVSELHAAHRDLRNTITVLRRERNTISKQLRTTDRRAASLAHDLKHIAHVAAESVETTTKLEAKLERSFAEFKWEADYHGKILGQFDDTIGSLDAKIVAGIEDADSALEADRRAQWARLHRWRREDDQTAGRFGFMHSTSAYLEDKVATLCRLVGIKFEGMLSVSVGSTKALARKPRPE